ncbi:MAG: hypothetical protein ACFFEJ_11430 [Candidatus Thorarchaeota archaeon]
MSMNMKVGLRKVVVIITVMMLVSSSLMFPVSAASIPEVVEPQVAKATPALIHIYYDKECLEARAMLLDSMNPLLQNGILVDSFDVSSILQLEAELDRYRPDYAIYYFQSCQAGLMFREEITSWKVVAETLADFPRIEHIFGVGSAFIIKDYLGEPANLHVDDSEVIDVRLGRLYALWEVADTMALSDEPTWAAKGECLRETVLRDFSDNINEYMAKGVVPEEYTGEHIPDPITDPALTESWVIEEKQYDDKGEELMPIMRLGIPAQSEDYIGLREMAPTSGVGGPMGWLIDTVLYSMIDLGLQNLAIHIDAAEDLNDYMQGAIEDARDQIKEWFIDEGFNITNHDFATWMPQLLPRQMFDLWSMVDQLILDAWYEVDEYIGEFFDWIINTPVQDKLTGLVPVFLFRLGTPINLGSDFASFGAVLRIKLLPDFEIDKTPFESFMNQAVLGGKNMSEFGDVEEQFTEIRKFIDIIPVMEIDLGVCAFLPTGNDWVQGLMGQFTIEFFGHAWLKLAFPPMDASNTDRAFIDVREWGLRFELDASFSLSISAFLSPGGAGVISTIMEWFSELLSISITLTLSIVFEISKKYQGQGLPSLSTLLLDIIIGVTLHIRLLIVIFEGTFKVGLRFEMRSGILAGEPLMALAADPDPVIIHTLSDIATSTIGIYITLYCSLYFGIDLFFTSFGTHFGGPWTTTIDISASWGSSSYGEEAADLTDTDEDGLPDDFETRMSLLYGSLPGYTLADSSTFLDPLSADTDGDGLNDKLEIELNTAPWKVDSDDDLLTDYEEHVTFKTNPLLNDTDRDNLTDYQEVKVYHTSPFLIDTDGDMLYDWYEINTVYDVTLTKGTYGSVESVIIGGVSYDDRTDPLNPDTDNDGLLDGEEWDNGVEYCNETEVSMYQYVNFRWTHPLDADTDEDCVAWLYQGGGWGDPFAPTDDYIWDLHDGTEVFGQIAIIPDLEGYPEVKLVKTNPCNPDTDNDTAWGAVYLYLTDGNELARDPQWDPTNGDQDSDGLRDGYEQIGPGGSGTDAQNPDTDNDHLPDYEDWMLDTDPRNPDCDEDMVLDGDEYFLYGTNPLNNDTDRDGLTDGEELFFFYCNPLVRDSDYDGLTDGEEILIYLTDPLEADTDHDDLTDGYEIFYAHTDPRLWDTDNDRLGDGEELLVFNSDPLDWDTDHDSLDYPNENGSMTLPLSDGDEVLDYGTSPITMDTDADGLTDSQEIYLGLGWPGHDPVPLDPLNNDTDGDTLLDGTEMILENVSIITFPYEALTIVLRYGSCPVLNDTDGDGLDDGLELFYGTYPNNADSDDDRINDYNEIFVTHTNPMSNDTDGDELGDALESWEMISANTTPPEALMPPFFLAQANESWWPLYPTNVTDSDTDDDYLPDGLEYVYGLNPLEWDENGNGIADGFEYDFDGDGLSDGEEFYFEMTWMTPLPIGNDSSGLWHWNAAPGGFDNPDSDGDGLDDGLEVKVYGTDPTSTDTDGDGVPDNEEVALGQNPLVPITEGYPFWMLAAILGGAGFIAGIIVPPVLRFTVKKVGSLRSGDKTESKADSKKTTKKADKTEATDSKKTTKSSKTKSKKEGDTK